MIRRRRRVIGTVANLVLLHTVWVGSGLACIMRDMGSLRAGSMAGMSMPGMPTGPTETPSKALTQQEGSCRFPWAPDGCQAATPCLPLAITSPEQVSCVGADVPAAAAAAPALTPPSPAHPPQPPPPNT